MFYHAVWAIIGSAYAVLIMTISFSFFPTSDPWYYSVCFICGKGLIVCILLFICFWRIDEAQRRTNEREHAVRIRE